MSVNNRQMSVSAKLKHHIFEAIDRSDAAANMGRPLHHPTRDIIIAEPYVEVLEQHAVTVGTYVLGDGTDVDAYGTVSVPIATTAGLFTTDANFTRGTAGRIVPAGTKVWANHTQVAQAGEGHVHLWYYLGDNKSDMEVN